MTGCLPSSGVSAFFSALWKAIVWVAKALWKVCCFLSDIFIVIGLIMMMNDIYEGITSRKK